MRLLLTILGMALLWQAQGQTNCSEADAEFILEIKTDNYGYETAWELKDGNGMLLHWTNFNTYGNRQIYRDTICLPPGCMHFTIFDGFGDGIAAIGYYKLYLNGQVIQSGGRFGRAESTLFQCREGEICQSAIPVKAGNYTAAFDDTWYVFQPDSTGIYHISTCDMNACDTKIWVYDRCEGIRVHEDNRSTIFYNDDENPCAPLAKVTGYLKKGETYYIRIGDKEDACSTDINWELIFEGPVIGCMDPGSCNYDPLATIDDGSCLPQGHDKCPIGPDLRVREDVLIQTLALDRIESIDPCMIEEGCLRGYGMRDILRFSTHIENIGEKDYYIGKPDFDNPLFNWNNCHNHFHYDSYAEYLLFRDDGTEIPIGFKNGFCITDFGCPPGRLPKYSCDNMGLSAGCYDIYWSQLQCQWIDLTDVPDGRYVFVVRINWKNLPDALGQIEKDTSNNWAQVCITLDRSDGKLKLVVEEACAPMRDCAGKPYGNTQTDCTGVCGGAALMGDVDGNDRQTLYDAHTYVTQILGEDIAPASCNDLDADGRITVYDAALIAKCVNRGSAHQHNGGAAHDHCSFPAGIRNPKDTVTLRILDVNWAQKYVDIGIQNPTAQVLAYEFNMAGIRLSYVENLVNSAQYPIAPRTSMLGGKVIGISYVDSLIEKSSPPQPLCRVYFQEMTADSIFIEQVTDIINSRYERVVTRIDDSAVYRELPSSASDLQRLRYVRVSPNPFLQETTISFYNRNGQKFTLDIISTDGEIVRRVENITRSDIRVKRLELPRGIYFFRLYNEKAYADGKLITL